MPTACALQPDHCPGESARSSWPCRASVAGLPPRVFVSLPSSSVHSGCVYGVGPCFMQCIQSIGTVQSKPSCLRAISQVVLCAHVARCGRPMPGSAQWVCPGVGSYVPNSPCCGNPADAIVPPQYALAAVPALGSFPAYCFLTVIFSSPAALTLTTPCHPTPHSACQSVLHCTTTQ